MHQDRLLFLGKKVLWQKRVNRQRQQAQKEHWNFLLAWLPTVD
jgi:hypothetical protein